MSPHNGTTTPPSGFNERGFEQLASELDRIATDHRELFLTKLVISLATRADPDTLGWHIARAQQNLAFNHQETT